MQPDVVIQTAVVRVKRAPHPLKTDPRRLLRVIIAVVHFHRDNVIRIAEIDQTGEIQPEGGDAVFIQPGVFAIHPEPARLFEPLEFQEHLAVAGAGGQLEMLAVPSHARVSAPVAAAVADEVRIGIHVIISMRRTDGGPLGIIKGDCFRIRDILADEFPIRVEIVNPARRGRRRKSGGQTAGVEGDNTQNHQTDQDYFFHNYMDFMPG